MNLVAPEENSLSLSHYDDEMRALGLLSRWNRSQPGRQPVHIALHAGELVPEVLPPGEVGQTHLRSHIRRAVGLAGPSESGMPSMSCRKKRPTAAKARWRSARDPW